MIELRAATDADRPAVLAFMAEAAGPTRSQTLDRRWHWQWHEDPRLKAPGYKGVVATWNERVMGHVACMPAGMYIEGSPVDAVWLVDVRIHRGLVREALKDSLRRGVGKRDLFPNGLAAALFDHPAAGDIQLGKHIGEDMMAIGHRVGFRGLPDAGNRMRRVSFRWPLQQAIGRRPGALLAALADLGIRLPRRPRLQVQRLDGAFDTRFDELWQLARDGYPAITLRDSAVLNWHYRAHPDTDYEVLTVYEQDKVRGYLIYKTWLRKGRYIARIVDLLTAPEDAAAIESLAAAALRGLRRAGVERVDWFVSGAGLLAQLERLGFKPRFTRRGKPQPMLARGLPALTSLYITSGDGDGG
jgi:hypothetical protein